MLYFVASRGHPLLPLSFFVSESTALVASWYVQIIFAIHEFILVFEACERGESSKSCNLIGSESGRFFTICPLTRAESLAASVTSLFVVCEWAKPVIFNHFSYKTCDIISIS